MGDTTHQESRKGTVTITIPTFAGYKTLAVNTVVAVLALLAVLFPGMFSGVTPDQVAAGYEQITGAIVLVLNIVNIFLRLGTAEPPAINPLGVEPPITPDEKMAAEQRAFAAGIEQGRMTRNPPTLTTVQNAAQELKKALEAREARYAVDAQPERGSRPVPPASLAFTGALIGGTLLSFPLWLEALKVVA